MPDRTIPGEEDATVVDQRYLRGPRAGRRSSRNREELRVYKYEYGPRNKGGHYAMGMEAGWDVHLILGTVPVEEDGSASFKIPANTPISLQPLDEEGKALQLMRSWLVGMPGERLPASDATRTPIWPRRSAQPGLAAHAEQDHALARPDARIQLRT